jgi:hypothetical protein
MTRNIQDAVLKIFPTGTGSLILNVLEQAGVAGEIIEEFCEKYPNEADKLNSSFLSLAPPPLLINKDPRLYHHHVRELLHRVMNGDNLEWGSMSEILCALSDASLKAPLSSSYASVMEFIFAEVFGSTPDGESVRPETYIGERHELINSMRKQLRQERTV